MAKKLKTKECQVWWYTLVIPALRRLRQPLGYRVRTCLKKKKRKRKQISLLCVTLSHG
jgi:hypothetical protein